jgi:BirA family biotin operon repressor/biotin-[acetyl-CoA-carboxylase] ligase
MEPGKGLALSVLLHAGCAPRGAGGGRGAIPLAAGLALARGLEALGVRADLKWPNDLLIGGRKLAGILCESRRGAGAGGWESGDAVVIGVGVNVREERSDFPEALSGSATSLAIEGCGATREEVAAEFLNALEPLWTELEEGDPAAVLAAWRERAAFWGRTVRVRTPAGDVTGVARGLDAGGGLVIESDGRAVTVLAGDLELAGAAEAGF